jgi:hypothetical protein
VASQRLIALLVSNGLMGSPLSDAKFLAGDRFFQYVSFLGCSPSLSLLPEQGDDHLRIEISSLVRPVLSVAQRVHIPLCLHCGKPHTEGWQWRIGESIDGSLKCGSCDQSNRIEQLNFRRRACYSRNFIRISPVFESEAIPAPQLLQALQSEFDTPFQYAYL